MFSNLEPLDLEMIRRKKEWKSKWGFCSADLKDMKTSRIILLLEFILAACYIMGIELSEKGQVDN